VNDPSSAFQPYVGVGVNYTIFFDENFTAANDAAGLTDLKLDNSFGLSAQIGLDFMLNDHWHVNGSVRWIDIDTEASFQVGGAPGRVDNITIDPWVYTLSVGYKF
jgi:outer membrane protein